MMNPNSPNFGVTSGADGKSMSMNQSGFLDGGDKVAAASGVERLRTDEADAMVLSHYSSFLLRKK